MSDNFEDIEHQETVHPEEGGPAGTGARSNLAEAWRTRPIFKLLVVMVVAGAAIAAGTTFFGGSGKTEQNSRNITPPTIKGVAGGQSSDYFNNQVKEAEQQRTKEALASNQSSLPTPIGAAPDINITEKTDPMNELRGETERLKQQLEQMKTIQNQQQAQKVAQAAQQVQPQAVAKPPEQFDPSLSQAMQGQMKQLMDSWLAKGGKTVEISPLEKDASGNVLNGSNAGTEGIPGVASVSNKIPPKPLVTAGTISYAQLMTEANSDVPAPILAQIVSGPLNGAKAIGAFQVAAGYNDYLVLTFTLANLKGKDIKINAIALDPDTTLAGMATEVDQRYFTRLILPAAAAFLQGFGSALSQTQSSIVENGDSTIVSNAGPGITQGIAQGASNSASTAAQFFQDQANLTKPLIRIAAGTPMGMFFVSTVYSRDSDDPNAATNGGCPTGTSPGYSAGGKILPVPAGSSPNGCFPASQFNGASALNGLGALGLGGGLPGAATQVSTVPYPNYAGNNTANGNGYGRYGSGGGAPFGGGSSTYYGH